MSAKSVAATYKTSLLLGGASVLNVLAGLARNKVVAIFLGPAGVGVIGLLQMLLTTASSLATLGLNQAGVRELSASRAAKSENATGETLWVLTLLAVGLAALGALMVVVFRKSITLATFGTLEYSTLVGWTSVAILLSVASVPKIAKVNSARQVGTYARLTVASGVLSTIVAVSAVVLFGERGIPLVVVATPALICILAYASARAIEPSASRPGWDVARSIATRLVIFGIPLMVSGLVVTASHLVVRVILQRELGVAALGIFTAAWIISQNYIGFLYTAITTDYYPRLTEAIENKEDVSEIINQQTLVGVMLAAPLFVVLAGFSPLVVKILFSEEFEGAGVLIRYMVFGDVLKVIEYPLAFSLLATASGKSYLFLRAVGSSVFVGVAAWLVGSIGMLAGPLAYIAMHLVYFPLLLIAVRRKSSFRLQRKVAIVSMLVVLSVGLVSLAAYNSERLAMAASTALVLLWAFPSMQHVRALLYLKRRKGKK